MTPGRAVPPARRRLFRDDWALAEQLARALARALAPLQALADAPPGGHAPAVRVDAATRLLAAALDIAVTDAEGNAAAFWQETAGEALAELLGGLLAGGQLDVPPQEFPGFLAAAMRSVTVTPAVGADTRIHIWGTLEARLQSVDRLILAGLDETVWPGETRTDPWLSRRMRAVIGLPPPERRIGQAAHDFTAALATGEVIVTRAEKRGGAPTVPSRWLQRITALVDKDGAAMMLARGDRYVALARRLEHVAPEEIRPAPRPEPRPPVAARPRQLSISDIERLIRDPYSIYARKVLRLDPLEPLGRPADARLRGTLVHEALSRFTLGWQGPFDDDARRGLLRIWAELFREIEDFPEVHAVWWLRSQEIARWVINWEAGRDGIASRHAEIAGRIEFEAPGGPFRLTGRADRIDLRSDGRVEIFDYKTGNPPTARQVLPFQPQLALEAAMVTQGGFGDAFAGRSVAELAWIGLGRVGKSGDPVSCAYEEPWTPDSIGVEAHSRLKALIARYDDVAKGYPSKAKPMFERGWPGDYDHLARVAEWRLGGGRESA
jgi:ATP-dependent helicase/nuclease subunit B